MKSLKEHIDHLRAIDEEQLNLAMAIIRADDGKFYNLDFLFLAAINRSKSNVSAFIRLIESENYFAAVPFIRMQIDSVLRLYSTYLVKDPQDHARKILNGIPVSKIADRNGTKMRDAYLIEIVAKTDPWIKTVYNSGSGFIHLSEKHIFGLFADRTGEDTFNISIGPGQPHIPDSFRIEAVAAISHTTSLIMSLCKNWLDEKLKA